MIALPGYQINEKIYEGLRTIVYRVLRTEDGQSVIMKTLKTDYPSQREISRLNQEYEISNKLGLEKIVRADKLEKYNNNVVLILEDFGGQSLKDLLNLQKLNLLSFLNIAICITDILGQIHEKNVIHKDIKPQNIIINPLTKELKIADFSIASSLSRESQNINNPNLLEGTLAYMSPEQTGRMNRLIDYRTDFYSLGVTFYEMLTGHLPFAGVEPIEIVHSHIAKKAQPLHELNSEIPQALSEIVMKLLAKTAEERYQSAYGIKADLEKCLHQLQTKGKIDSFILGENDVSAKFQIPQKLYGREAQISILMSGFERVAQGVAEMTLVSGYSGIGKTALINEIHKPVVRQRGYFIAGKYDQYKRNIPYASLIQAFQELMRQLLTENAAQISDWKVKILDALGANAQIIIDVIPEVELLVGEQPAVVPLEGGESQNRFNLVFQKFIGVFSKKEHPLVLFLDDLQWADLASLKLLQSLMTSSDSQYLLLIGAYRDNEVNPAHPLMLTLDEIKKSGARVNAIALQPLDIRHVSELVADSLHSELQKVKPLAELVFHKTGGNPFFLNQLLRSLYQENLLLFDFNTGCWQWNLEQIQRKGITDNVVELMVGKLQKLGENTQNALKIAACIGNVFDLNILAIVGEQCLSAMASNLWEALQEGLIIPLSNDYKIALIDDPRSAGSLINNELKVSYKFAHDRIQQAAYSLISEREHKQTHLKIGRLMLQNTPEEKLEDKIFDIVNQLNLGVELVESPQERYDIANLNLTAGKKAKISNAYETALKCFNLGLEILPGDIWSEYYQLTFALYKELAECEYVSANFSRAEEITNLLLTKAKDSKQKNELYNLKVISYAFQNKAYDAIRVGIEALNNLGINVPATEEEAKTAIAAELKELQENLGNRSFEELINMPNMEDVDKQAIIKIMFHLSLSTYQVNKNLYTFNALKMINLSLKFGFTNESPDAFCNYALIAGPVLEDYKTGYECAKFGLKLNEKLKNSQLASKINFWSAMCVIHWRDHLKSSLPLFRKGYEYGLESGDLAHSMFSCFWAVMAQLTLGQNLDMLYQEAEKYNSVMEDNLVIQQLYELIKRFVLSLKGLTNSKYSLSDDSFQEEKLIEIIDQSDVKDLNLHFYHQFKLQNFWLFENYQAALDMAVNSGRTIVTLRGALNETEHYLYHSLTLTALYPTANSEIQQQYWETLQKNQAKLKNWADNCAENYLHKYLLVAAEIARISGEYLEAMDLYDRAIASARENEYTQNEAIANELAAKFYLARGKEKIAKVYLMDARYGYLKWGATAKVKDLDEKYSLFLSRSFGDTITANQDTTNTSGTTSSTVSGNSVALDVTTIVKASQALAGEIVLVKLIDKLLKIVMENAGAQTSYLILEKNHQLFIEATGNVEKNEIVLLPSLPIENSQNLPVSLINYIARTCEDVVLNDATKEARFTGDAYIAKNKPKSVLGAPIINQGKFIGILYLENNLTAGAFTPDRLEVLRLLSSQAAISLENALLYANLQAATENLKSANNQLEDYSKTLENKVEIRTLELKEQATELEKTLHELKQTQTQLIHTEKMSSLGQMVAGVAHEINNPVNFIHGNINHITEYSYDLLELVQIYQEKYPNPAPEIQQAVHDLDLEFLSEDLPKLLKSIQVGTNRIRDIVLSLRNFSRLDEADMKQVDIHEGIDSTLLLLQHRLKEKTKYTGIEIVKEYGKMPLVECYAGQLNQVFMNILSNAIDALEASNIAAPEIRIRTEVINNGDRVAIRIADNGPGMTEAVRMKLFDPFFTTKAVGSGTGLGLSIAYKIVVDKHRGKINCISAPGEGAEFTIEIPVKP